MTESGDSSVRGGVEPLVVETFAIGSLGCNCSLVYERESRRAIVIDPGDDPEALLRAVGVRGLKVTQLLHTHAHFDHIGGSDAVKRPEAAIGLSAARHATRLTSGQALVLLSV